MTRPNSNKELFDKFHMDCPHYDYQPIEGGIELCGLGGFCTFESCTPLFWAAAMGAMTLTKMLALKDRE